MQATSDGTVYFGKSMHALLSSRGSLGVVSGRHFTSLPLSAFVLDP